MPISDFNDWRALSKIECEHPLRDERVPLERVHERNGRVVGLSLRKCGLEDVPEAIGDLTALEHLDLSDNYFGRASYGDQTEIQRSVKSVIERLPQIKEVDLRKNQYRKEFIRDDYYSVGRPRNDFRCKGIAKAFPAVTVLCDKR